MGITSQSRTLDCFHSTTSELADAFLLTLYKKHLWLRLLGKMSLYEVPPKISQIYIKMMSNGLTKVYVGIHCLIFNRKVSTKSYVFLARKHAFLVCCIFLPILKTYIHWKVIYL